jgi:antitoxin VapB
MQLPREIRLVGEEVEVFRCGDEIVLREEKGTMVRAFELLASLPIGLKVRGRGKDLPQRRKQL